MSAVADIWTHARSGGGAPSLVEFTHGLTPLFIGDERKLLVSFHASDPAAKMEKAVLLCNPFGQESMRAHRLYRVLAERLARAGIDTMRFDYYGTGDSYGEDHEGELVGWREDIHTAHRELLRYAGVRRATWVGIRLGATLALQAAGDRSKEIEHLVIVDPIIDGMECSRGLRRQHVERLESVFRKPDKNLRGMLAANPNAFVTEAFGFGLATHFHEQLAEIAADRLPLPPGPELTVIADLNDPAVTAWRNSTGINGKGEWLTAGHGYDWAAHEAVDGTLVPAKLLRDMAKLLGA